MKTSARCALLCALASITVTLPTTATAAPPEAANGFPAGNFRIVNVANSECVTGARQNSGTFSYFADTRSCNAANTVQVWKTDDKNHLVNVGQQEQGNGVRCLERIRIYTKFGQVRFKTCRISDLPSQSGRKANLQWQFSEGKITIIGDAENSLLTDENGVGTTALATRGADTEVNQTWRIEPVS